MALIKCVECGKEISDKAKQCPKCGWKIDLDAIKNTNTLQDTEIEEEPTIEIESEKGVPCFKSTIEENASSDCKEQAKENQKTNNIAYHDVDIKSDRETEQDICEDKNVNVVDYKETSPKKKGKFLKGVLIVGIALIVLGVWSVVLVKMTTNKIVKNLNISIESVDVVENEKSVEPKPTNKAVFEINQVEESTEISSSEIEVVGNSSNLIVQSDGIDVEYVGFENVADINLKLYFTVTNNTEEMVYTYLGTQYINKVNVLRFSENFNSEIQPGKAVQIELFFDIDKVDTIAKGIINELEIELYFNEDETPQAFTFDNLNIEY